MPAHNAPKDPENPIAPVAPVKNEETEELKEEPKKVEEAVSDANTGIVFNKEGKEVRTYTLFAHGDEFKDLTREYASSRGFSFKFVKGEDGIVCPSCGHRFTR